jgi:CubicO group peptidase (beta-lactamase class C family)
MIGGAPVSPRGVTVSGNVETVGAMVEVHGFCDERFKPLEEAFRASLDGGVDKGSSFAVTLHGEPVVDLWGGTRDYEMATPWESDTVVRVFSTSKVMVVLMVLTLVDRGLLDLDEPIASYWPEFARHGKGTITARQVLVHRSGLPGFGRMISFDEMSDPDRVAVIIEDAELWYEPGTISCYHAETFGAILGQLITRVSGSRFDEFFQSEIAGPLDADFHFGLPLDEANRISVIWPATGTYEMEAPMAAAVGAELNNVGRGYFEPGFLPRAIASGGGVTNARAMARVGTIIALGGVFDGRRYLSTEVIAQATAEQSYVEDVALGWCRYGLGLGLHTDDYPAPTPTTVHWGGYGGSFLTMDPGTEITCAFAQNQLLTDGGPRGDQRRVEYWRLLGEIIRTL